MVTLLDYAQRRLQQTDEQAALQRIHAEFFTEYTLKSDAQLMNPDQAIWLERLNLEYKTTCALLSTGRRNTTSSSRSVSPGRWGDSGTCRDTGAKGGDGSRICWNAKVHACTQARE